MMSRMTSDESGARLVGNGRRSRNGRSGRSARLKNALRPSRVALHGDASGRMRGGSAPSAASAANERAAAEAWDLARSSGSVRVPGDDVLDVVRSKIFRPDSRPNAPLREMWTETRGRFFPTKEELFRQQCVVTDSLKRSQRLMTVELERALDVLRRRDAHIANLERSLVQLSLEWYETGEENKRLAAAHDAAVARRRAVVLANVRRALTARAWHKWRHEVHARLRDASAAAVDDAVAAARALRDEKRETERRAAVLVEDRRARILRAMRNLPMTRAFRTWVAAVAAEKRRALETAATDAESAARVAVARLEDAESIAEARATEAEAAREDVERVRRRLWGAVRGLGLVAFRRDERDARRRALERWRSTARLALVARIERVVAGVEATRKAKAFKTWRAFVRDDDDRRGDASLSMTVPGSARRGTSPGTSPGRSPRSERQRVGGSSESEPSRFLSRSRSDAEAEASRLAAEVATLRDALETERAARRDESRDASRRLAASAVEMTRWRVAAERGWALTQRRAHAALRRVTLRARFRLFHRWRDAARFGSAVRSFRADAASRVSASESRVASLEAEIGALRLFRDAVASSDRSMLVRRGGGYVPVERYLSVVENRIAAAALEEALDADGDDAAKAKAARYGLRSALDALRGAVAGGGRAGEDVARDGSATRWRPAVPVPAPKPRRGRPPEPSEKEKEGGDGDEWTRLFGDRGIRDEDEVRRLGGEAERSRASSRMRTRALRVTRRNAGDAGARARLPGDEDRLAAAGGAGAGAATRRRLRAFPAAKATDAERAVRVSYERRVGTDAVGGAVGDAAGAHPRAVRAEDAAGMWTRALEENTETLADDDANAIDDAKVDPSAKGRARAGGGRGGRGNASRR